MPKALFVEIQAKAGSEDAIEQFLRQAVAAAEAEPDTRDWFALRFDADHFALFDTFDGTLGAFTQLAGWYALRTGPNRYVMIDVFPSAEARQIHLDGMATSGLAEQVGRYLEAMPEIRHAEVLASKQSGWRHVASTEQKVHPEQSVRIGPEAS